jgi:hypothetical protein
MAAVAVVVVAAVFYWMAWRITPEGCPYFAVGCAGVQRMSLVLLADLIYILGEMLFLRWHVLCVGIFWYTADVRQHASVLPVDVVSGGYMLATASLLHAF